MMPLFYKKSITSLGMIFLLTAAAFSGFVLGKEDEEEIEQLEWLEFLNTDLAKLSAPSSKNIYYSVVSPRNGGYGVRGNYMGCLNTVIGDELKGYDLYDGMGLLDSKNALFSYRRPGSSKNIGWLSYDYYYIPLWHKKLMTQGELRDRLIRYMLGGIDDLDITTPAKFYKEKKGDREFNVIEYEYKENGKNYKGFWYYLVSGDDTLCHYFSKGYEVKSKYADIANGILDKIIISSILAEDMDEKQSLTYMLYSARELGLWLEGDKKHEEDKDDKKKDAVKTISVKFAESSEEKSFDIKYEKLDDFLKYRQIINIELDRLAEKCPNNPKIYYAMAVLCEYNDSGVRYGDGFNESKAMECYAKALGADQKFFYAYYNKGILFARKKETDRAIEEFKKCINISPVDIPSLYMLGALYEGKGDHSNTYLYYRNAKDALTAQEKGYCEKLQKRLWKKCKDLENQPGIEKPIKRQHKKVIKSAMAHLFYGSPLEGNVFSYDDPFLFWHGYLTGVTKRNQASAKWYSPSGEVFKEEKSMEKVENDASSYYFALPVADTKAADQPGLWRIEVYYKDEIIDTKYFYILDC